jgi:hypothetical protein
MKEGSTCVEPISNPLPCSTIVYRAIRKNWISKHTGIIVLDAYLLRNIVHSNGREKELSVTIAELCSVEDCTAKLDGSPGVATLHVGRIRNIGLDVIDGGLLLLMKIITGQRVLLEKKH